MHTVPLNVRMGEKKLALILFPRWGLMMQQTPDKKPEDASLMSVISCIYFLCGVLN